MIEFYNLVKQLEKEKSELENILASSIVELEKAGLNTDKFEDTIFYTNSATDDIEEANEYAYIERMIGCHNIEYMVENKESSCISDYNKLKKLIEDWISSLSVRETLSDEEIDNQIEEAKKYFLEVLQDYKLADIDSDYFIERFNDDIKIIGKDSRQERREHGESIVDKDWVVSSLNIYAELDFEDKIREFREEEYNEANKPIWQIYEKYKRLNHIEGKKMHSEEGSLKQEIKIIMSAIDNSHEPFAHLIYEISQKINNNNYKYCYKLWNFNDMYQEYFGTDYVATEHFYKIQESMTDKEYTQYLKENEPTMYRIYWSN